MRLFSLCCCGSGRLAEHLLWLYFGTMAFWSHSQQQIGLFEWVIWMFAFMSCHFHLYYNDDIYWKTFILSFLPIVVFRIWNLFFSTISLLGLHAYTKVYCLGIRIKNKSIYFYYSLKLKKIIFSNYMDCSLLWCKR